jgi:hypothetical protein
LSTRFGNASTYYETSAYKDSFLQNKYWQANPDATYKTWIEANLYYRSL